MVHINNVYHLKIQFYYQIHSHGGETWKIVVKGSQIADGLCINTIESDIKIVDVCVCSVYYD